MGMFATGQFTIVDVNDSPSFELTAASLVLLADSTGAVSSYDNAQTQFKSVEAGRDKTNDWSYFVSGSGGGVTYRDSDDTTDRSAIGFADGGLGGVNLLPYSQQFNAAPWGAVGATVAGNAVLAPDGTMTGSVITFLENTTTSNSYVLEDPQLPLGQYVLSVYSSTQTKVFIPGGAVVHSQLSFTVTPTVGGWYRHVLVVDVTSGAFTQALFTRPNSLTPAQIVYLWGAQIEPGVTVSEYVPSRTTFTGRTSIGTYYDSTGALKTAAAGEARYSYNPANLAAGPALLLEAAATNLLRQTEAINGAPWEVCIGTTASTISAVGSGKFLVTSTSASGGVRQVLSALASGSRYTWSAHIESSVTNLTFGLENGDAAYGSTCTCVFNPMFGVFTSVAVGVDVSVLRVGLGWRVALTLTPAAGSLQANLEIRLASSGQSFIIGYPQFELGTFASSYIATTSSAVTRSADTSTSVAQSGTRGLLNITGLTQDSSYLDITARKTGSADVTKRLSLARVSKGADGPALAISATAQGFTFVDGVASPAEQYIGFQAVNYSTDTPVTWYTSTGDYLLNDEGRLHVEGMMTGMYGAGNGELAYMSLAQFGSADQITVTAVCGELSATFMVMRLSKSTAAAGATVGAPAGTTVGGTLAETVRDNAANALAAANTANTNLANKQDKASSDILTISTSDAVRMAGIRVGDLAWNGSGVRTSGKGLALTPQGLLGHNGTKTTFFIDAVTGNAVFDGTLDASAVTTGFINAARIQVGTATVSASGTSGSNMTFPLPGISTASVDGVSIGHTCTGSPVTVIATASSAVFSCDSNTSKVFFTHQLFVDGALASWVLENVQSTEYVNCIVWGTNREADSIGTIIFRFTPSLGTHSYQLKTTATLYNTSTGLTNFSVGSNLGFVNIRSQIIVTENKI